MSGQRVRYMRLIVFFDLPVGTSKQRREYSKFHKYLEKNGWLMMQESVYSKLAVNDKVVDGILNKLRDNRPPEGIVQVLKVTEKQFANIEYITGNAVENLECDDTENLVIL